MNNETQQVWLQSAQNFQQAVTDSWSKTFASFQNMDLGAAGLPLAAPTVQPPKIALSPEKMVALQQEYVAEATDLWNKCLQGSLSFTDRRFSDPAWVDNPLASFTAGLYLLNARTLEKMVDAIDTDHKTRARIRFAVEQINAASAPSNFLAFNAEALKKIVDTQGQSLVNGVQNLLKDIKQGHISMTDESLFEVGRNVATTEGAVVFENEFFQLIEYKPLTAQVYEKPFLLVPPCINKYYILDLQPDNSFVRYAVAQGHRTFLVSWRNPDASMAKASWDDYVEQGVIKAIEVTQEASGAKTINALGFCVGGTMLGCALAVLAARGEKPVASATLLTSMLDFSDTGVLDVFIDEGFVKYRETEMGQGGLMKGSDLASTFAFLRPNDLVWNYVVGNYLKGETPPPFDLLYWNSDSTNLAGPFYAWYLRNTYLENNLTTPGKALVCGEAVDLGKVDIPVYIYGSREDHIVPINGAYASTQHLSGPKRFVTGASGHIAGVINPPAKNKRCYWVRDDDHLPQSHADWMQGAVEHKGSWWTDWSTWLAAQAGKQVSAPKTYGKGKHKAIEPAPGRYVKAKA